ncbi:MAG: hypothetical protein IJ883_04930 [Eubacterium sp.]|nr:hypothetical protein [Eubacterium sp.]
MKILSKAISIIAIMCVFFSVFAHASTKSTTPMNPWKYAKKTDKLSYTKIIRTKKGITYTLQTAPKSTIKVLRKNKVIKKCYAKKKTKKLFIKNSLIKMKKGKLVFIQKQKNKKVSKSKLPVIKIGEVIKVSR